MIPRDASPHHTSPHTILYHHITTHHITLYINVVPYCASFCHDSTMLTLCGRSLIALHCTVLFLPALCFALPCCAALRMPLAQLNQMKWWQINENRSEQNSLRTVVSAVSMQNKRKRNKSEQVTTKQIGMEHSTTPNFIMLCNVIHSTLSLSRHHTTVLRYINCLVTSYHSATTHSIKLYSTLFYCIVLYSLQLRSEGPLHARYRLNPFQLNLQHNLNNRLESQFYIRV